MKNNEKEVSPTLVRACRLLLVIIIVIIIITIIIIIIITINTVIAADEYKIYVNQPSVRTCRDV